MNENTKNGLRKMLVDSVTQFRIDRQKYKEGYLSPKFKPHAKYSNLQTQANYQDIKRPLKTNYSDISFEGLFSGSMYKTLDKTYNLKEFFDFSDKYFGKMGKKLYHDILVKNKNRSSSQIQVRLNEQAQALFDSLTPAQQKAHKFKDEDYEIIIHKKTIPHLALDGILYPFKILPADLLNGFVELLGKIPFLKKWSQKVLDKPFFRNVRQRSKIDAKINSLVGMITYRDEKIESAVAKYAKENKIKPEKVPAAIKEKLAQEVDAKMDSSVFQSGMKMFDPKTGNYDTKHERALNRLVSGLPPAIFLANDAYNLSRMMDDDPKAAEKERKIRFRQETSRILTSGYLTLITMGAFQKFINKSKMGIVLTTGITVLVTEMFSRLSNGKHITRLTPEKAREINKKENNPESKIKPLSFKADEKAGKKTESKKQEQKPLLSFDTLLKGSAIVIGTGYAIKFSKLLPFVKKGAAKYFENLKVNNLEKFEGLKLKSEDLASENVVETFIKKVIYKPFTDLYKKMTTQTFHVDAGKFNETVRVLRQNGFKELADKYQKIAKTQRKIIDGKKIIDFEQKDRKIAPLVNFVIAPFKFIWNTITLPYWMIDEKLMGVFRKAKPKPPVSDLKTLAQGYERVQKYAIDKKLSKKEFQDFIQDNFLKGFNLDSMSSVSNAELSNLAKTAASIATIWFLMTDNYNMVMLKSNGNDKDGAETKFKERFVQEGSRLFYQTLLIDLFNSTFRNSYNASLLGMSWVTLADTTLGEILTRSSVGIATKRHTRDELIALETEQNNATGFKRKYYDFMQRLTGKRSIKSYEVKAKNENLNRDSIQKSFEPSSISSVSGKSSSLAFSNASTLETIIKNNK